MNNLQHTNRIHILDVFRGLAATAVVMHHVLRCTPGLNSDTFWKSSAASNWWVKYLFIGDLAVTLFFVLSGASLALSSKNTTLDITGIKYFYVKRFFRIYPLYVLSIFVYYIFRYVYPFISSGPYNNWLSPQFVNHISLKSWITYLTMSFNFFQIPVIFFNALWSLPMEFQFYLFFPLLFYFCFNRPMNTGTILVILFSGTIFIISSVFHIPGETLGRLWEFGGGVLLGVNIKYISFFFSSTRSRFFLLICAIFLFMVRNIHLGFHFPSNFIDVIVCFIITTLGLSMNNWQAKNRMQEILVYIGIISYGLYVWHILLLGIVSPILDKLHLPALIYSISLFAIAYPSTIILSGIIYNQFEKPLITIGRSFIKKK
jgi:peptidoglycan/LPS O-acetylase OafA/YrhL